MLLAKTSNLKKMQAVPTFGITQQLDHYELYCVCNILCIVLTHKWE